MQDLLEAGTSMPEEAAGSLTVQDVSLCLLDRGRLQDDTFPKTYDGTPGQCLTKRFKRNQPATTESQRQGAHCDADGTLPEGTVAKEELQPLSDLTSMDLEQLLGTMGCTFKHTYISDLVSQDDLDHAWIEEEL